MRTLVHLTGIMAVALAGSALQATDFGPLVDVVKSTWPERTHVAVVADAARSQEDILALARTLGEGSTLTVLDVQGRSQIDAAGNQLLMRASPDYLVLLPEDPRVHDGSLEASRLVRQVAARGIPTLGTTRRALAQGAVFVMGADTGYELLEADRMVGTIEVILPEKGRFLNKVAWQNDGMATITTIAGF